MIKRLFCTVVAVVMMVQSLCAMTQSEEIALIKSRYCEFLARTAPPASEIKGYLDRLDIKSGAWSDIDYASTIGSGWRTKEHTSRTMKMAQYYAGDHGDNALFTHKELSEAIHSVWAYWFREKPWCPTNWFPNLLSCPREMGTSFMLMQDEMSEQEQADAVTVYNRSKMQKTGSNLIYVATTALMQGIFENNTELIKSAVEAISGTIFIAGRGVEGIQSDYSYHLHGSQLQFGTYGREAMGAITPFCAILADTSYAFTDEQIDILSNLFTQGYRWVLWRGYMDMIASGRQYGADMFKDKALSIMESAERMVSVASPEQRAQIEAMLKENDGVSLITLTGQKHFYKSDCVTHRRPTWAASLKMHSTRVKGMEMSINDNRRGFFVSDGALYIYVDGGDYENTALLWDWRKIPGITSYEVDEPVEAYADTKKNKRLVNATNFVGSCNDGVSGISTMVLDREGLFARKSWVMTPEFVLCIGSDIRDESGNATLTTSIDQRRKSDDLLMLKGRKWSKIQSRSLFEEKGTRLYHDRIGYVILDDTECEARVDYRSEDWFNITRGVDPQVDNGLMMSVYLRHKSQPSSYQYLILPDMSAEEVAKFDLRQIEIIYNSADIQLVRNGEQYYATIYKAGVYPVDKRRTLDVKRAGIYMFNSTQNGWEIIAHDPTQEVSDDEMRVNIDIVSK